MGKGHIAVNKYISDKVRFADLINGKIFGGEQIVSPEELEKRGIETLLCVGIRG